MVIVFGTFLSTIGLLTLAFLGFENLLILFVLKTNKTKLIATKIKRINVILYIILLGFGLHSFGKIQINSTKCKNYVNVC